MLLDDDISKLKGVGPKTAGLYSKLGIFKIRDLLMYYPKEYVIYEKPGHIGNVAVGEKAFIYVRVKQAPDIIKTRTGLTITSVMTEDDRGVTVQIIYYNQPYLRQIIKTGQSYIFVGRKTIKNRYIAMEAPERYTYEEYKKIQGRFTPVYPLTKGITRKSVMDLVEKSFDGLTEKFESILSEADEKKNKFIGYDEAIHILHFPKNEKEYLAARRRIAFEEFYVFLTRLNELKSQNLVKMCGLPMHKTEIIAELAGSLPYDLTGAQKRAVTDIVNNMYSGRAMNRLLQGDVGSGKTIVAFMAMLETVYNGYQAVLMAPTEVLATQHYNGLLKLLSGLERNVRVSLLTGSQKASEKKQVLSQIKNHETDIIIGTHAVFQTKVEYDCLALVISDEQHRFGVTQREMLENKGINPHVLMMSATPIPRSLAGVLYADMDVTIIDEKPACRQPIKNCVVGPDYHEKAYNFMEQEISQGHQAYVICTLVEESEEMSGENVVDYTKKLQDIFKNRTVAMLHGRMKNDDKEKITREFAAGNIDILVSTTVVEVGVDVPNATVMMIEDAQKFGLATLHQLRGRVGRGSAQSYCIFIDSSGRPEDNGRLKVMNSSQDGFHIAEEDLKLRGPGDLFGVRQSGELSFRIADIYRDSDLLMLAASMVKK